VLDRIPCQSPELVRGGVALAQGCVAVRVLVRDHREEENGRNQDEPFDVEWVQELAR